MPKSRVAVNNLFFQNVESQFRHHKGQKKSVFFNEDIQKVFFLNLGGYCYPLCKGKFGLSGPKCKLLEDMWVKSR